MEYRRRQSDKFSEKKSVHNHQSADFWCKSLAWFAFAGWVALFGVLYTFEKARPPVETFCDRFFDVKVRTNWDIGLMVKIPYLMIAGLCFSTLGLFINSRRHKRRNDSWRISIILPGFLILIMASFWLIYTLINDYVF